MNSYDVRKCSKSKFAVNRLINNINFLVDLLQEQSMIFTDFCGKKIGNWRVPL